MSFINTTRHRLGFHTGAWTRDVEGQCDQTRTCTGCGKVNRRIQHSFGDWTRRQPCDEDTCGMVQTCRICRETAFKAEHEFAWHYFSELPRLRDFPAKTKLAKVWVTSPCKQFSMCDHCHKTETEYRVWHDWGPREIGGVERTQVNDGVFDSPIYYHACKICDKRAPG